MVIAIVYRYLQRDTHPELGIAIKTSNILNCMWDDAKINIIHIKALFC